MSLAGAVSAAPFKSDPAKLYLDPEEIRPYIEEEITEYAESVAEPGQRFAVIKGMQVRLINGYMPVYDIRGEVVAYYYIASVVPGKLPTFDDIYASAREAKPLIESYLRNGGSRDRPDIYFNKYFSYEMNCAHAFVGLNGITNCRFSPGIPVIIRNISEVEKVAADHFGPKDFKIVRFMLLRDSGAYELSDGVARILVPIDTLSGEVYSDKVITSEEAEKNPDDYDIQKPDSDMLKSWAEFWERKLDSLGESKNDGK